MKKQKDGFRVAVVGATGVVGEAMLEQLALRKFPSAQVACHSKSSQEITFKGQARRGYHHMHVKYLKALIRHVQRVAACRGE